MSIKALIFDFDLTLADSSQGIFNCMNHSLNSLGFAMADMNTIRKTIGHNLMDSFRMITGNSDAKTAEEFVKIYVSHADKVMNVNTFVYPQVYTVLPEIKKNGYKTAIVSTKYRYRISDVLKREMLEIYFDCVIGGEDVAQFKPDPEGLLNAIKILQVQKEEVLYIGDSVVDAQTAQNADVRFCAVLTGASEVEDFSTYAVDSFITNLSEMPELLK